MLLSVRQKPNSPGAVSDTVSIRLVTMCNSCSDQSVGSKKEASLSLFFLSTSFSASFHSRSRLLLVWAPG